MQIPSIEPAPVAVKERLRSRIPLMKEILQTTRQPGMSIGVIYDGEEIMKENYGVLDIETGQKPDSDTLYCIASLSKAFMTASLDLLVQEGKLSWDSTIQSILPEFNHVQSPHLSGSLTLRDMCSHRSGLLSMDDITQGLDARILLPKKDVVQICNSLPIKHDLRTRFLYNNALFELAGHVVERVAGVSNWGEFQQERLYSPLGMTRTTAFREVHKTDDNIAVPYQVLSNGAPVAIPPTELSAASMNGGSGGLRSSVNDLLKWCACLLASFHDEETAAAEASPSPVRRHSPIFQRETIGNPESAEDGDYCAGWCYHRTPGSLGLISPNRSLASPVLGTESPSLLLYGHQGDVPGYTCNLYLVPDKQSALVILSNGKGLSDATDWIAQDLLQSMFALCPAVDFADIATQAAATYLSRFTREFQIPLQENRVLGTQPPSSDALVGTYVMEGLDLVSLDVAVDAENLAKLTITVNKQPDQVWTLWHYHWDVFCYLPDTFDEFLARGYSRDNWTGFLISFTRDTAGKISGLDETMAGVVVHFTRS